MALTLVSEPSEFSWSRHPLKFVASSDAAGSVRIRQELRLVADDSLVAKTANLSLDNNSEVSYDWSKVVTDQVSQEVPQLVKLGYVHTKSTLAYYVRFVEVVDGVDGATLDSSDRIAVFGSNEYYTTQYNYLPIDVGEEYLLQTGKPIAREHWLGQEDVVTVLFTKAFLAPNLRVTIHYSDATTHVLNNAIGNVAKGQCVTFDLSDRAWDWTAYQPGKTISKIEVGFPALTGDVLTLLVNSAGSLYAHSYVFANNRGGFDVLFARGERIDIEKIEGEVYQDDKNLLRVRQDIRQDIYEQSSGYLPRSEVMAYKQMRDVNRVWYVTNGILTGLVLFPQETTVVRESENINYFTFKWTAGHGRQDFDVINAL